MPATAFFEIARFKTVAARQVLAKTRLTKIGLAKIRLAKLGLAGLFCLMHATGAWAWAMRGIGWSVRSPIIC
jgi:hypothetical protein